VAYQTSAGRYRESEVLTASGPRLLIITFDFLLSQFARAKVGMEMKNREITITALDKARQAVGELAATLDLEHGGEMAHRLRSIYVFEFAELAALGLKPDVARLEKNAALMRELRDAFASAAHPAKAEVA
jgi:flagellar secretion chaperone FliS